MPEKRLLDITSRVEIRKDAQGKMIVAGLIPYNSPSERMWDFVEVIDPTAFNKTLADKSNVYALWAHDERDILGATSAGTLRLEDSLEGLRFEIDVRDGSADHFQAIERGDVQGVSFGFYTRKDEWDFTAETPVRRLKEVQLLEVSPGVAFPAYPGAQSEAAKRTLESELPRIKEQRSKLQPEPQSDDSLKTTEEQRQALLSRARAELDLICEQYGLTQTKE